jgi:hypothetical protein
MLRDEYKRRHYAEIKGTTIGVHSWTEKKKPTIFSGIVVDREYE